MPSYLRPISQQDTSELKCVTCGSPDITVIRPDPQNPRCKCETCGFVFNGEDSFAAQEAGAIPDSSAESLAEASEPQREVADMPQETRAVHEVDRIDRRIATAIPRQPKYLFITKDRKNCLQELVTEKDAKKAILRWEHRQLKYDVYELSPTKFDVKVNLG